MPQTRIPGPCGPSLDPAQECPDLGPDEVCLSSHCATPDPPEAFFTNERVKASTRWVGSSNPSGINKRPGWAVGLWRYANDIEPDADQPPSGPEGTVGGWPGRPPPQYWFRCTGFDANGNPVFAPQPHLYGIGDRPDLTYAAGQPLAHGILQEQGRLVSITIRVKPPNAAEVPYTWNNEINAKQEWVLHSA